MRETHPAAQAVQTAVTCEPFGKTGRGQARVLPAKFACILRYGEKREKRTKE